MGRWVFAACCVFGMVVSAITLYSTNQTLQELKRVRVMRVRPAVASRPRPADRPLEDHINQSTAPSDRSTETAPATTQPPHTVKLFATIMDPDPIKSTALLEDGATGTRRMYAVGETIQGYQVAEINRGYVVLALGDRRERIDLEAEASEPAASGEPPMVASGEVGSSGWGKLLEPFLGPKPSLSADEAATVKSAITRVSDTERVVDRQAVWNSLKGNPFPIASEATIFPVFASGHLEGFRLASIASDGILQHSGFQPDDVIQSINGKPVTDSVAMLQVPAYLQGDEVRVQVDRHGQPVTLTFRFQ